MSNQEHCFSDGRSVIDSASVSQEFRQQNYKHVISQLVREEAKRNALLQEEFLFYFFISFVLCHGYVIPC